ncbi:SA1362 family protein [Niallia sp. Krafla_26]|uniref:SA1362 family protein n=1 Tax=Niallia sp. Krafla_26 TaxID=3064703 RepID=UPI003D168528
MAFLKNRTTNYIVYGVIGLAIIGLLSKLFSNPAGFFKGIAIIIGIAAVVFLLFKLLYKPSPAKREQQAFRKAAKRSAKRNQKDAKPQNRMMMKTQKKNQMKKKPNLTSIKSARALKKKNARPQLTVIEGKKGKSKRKNRASFL